MEETRVPRTAGSAGARGRVRPAGSHQAVLLYDEDCGLCRWTTDKILRWDREGKLRPLPLQDPEADRLLGAMDPEVKMQSWHLVTPDGRVHSAGAAVEPLLRLLPYATPVAAVVRAMPGITARAYRWTADHRDEIGRRLGAEACAVDPTSSGRHQNDTPDAASDTSR